MRQGEREAPEKDDPASELTDDASGGEERSLEFNYARTLHITQQRRRCRCCWQHLVRMFRALLRPDTTLLLQRGSLHFPCMMHGARRAAGGARERDTFMTKWLPSTFFSCSSARLIALSGVFFVFAVVVQLPGNEWTV